MRREDFDLGDDMLPDAERYALSELLAASVQTLAGDSDEREQRRTALRIIHEMRDYLANLESKLLSH